jgi:hypothetical protein
MVGQVVAVCSTDAGRRVAAPVHLEAESAASALSGDLRRLAGITSSAGAFHLVWNDTRTGKLDLFAATVRP